MGSTLNCLRESRRSRERDQQGLLAHRGLWREKDLLVVSEEGCATGRLHALATGVTVLELFRENWKSIPSWGMDADLIDKLPLLVTRIVNENLDNQTPSFGTLKRKHFHDGLQDTAAESSKKQKMTVKEEPVEY